MEFLSENVISNFDSFSMSALGLTGMMLLLKKFCHTSDWKSWILPSRQPSSDGVGNCIVLEKVTEMVGE